MNLYASFMGYTLRIGLGGIPYNLIVCMITKPISPERRCLRYSEPSKLNGLIFG